MEDISMGYLAVSNTELEEDPYLDEGQFIAWKCKHKKHKIERSTSKSLGPIYLNYIKCGKRCFLVGISGKDIRRPEEKQFISGL